MAEELANEAADAWWLDLCDRIDPNHEEESKRSMEAKWLISICTPYDGSKFAIGLTRIKEMIGMESPRVHHQLKKHSDIAKIIGEDAREKSSLGDRKVYNIACETTDQFVSEGSATVNYDYRYTKTFKNLAHVGVLFSPRVAKAIGGWLDGIYDELDKESQENQDHPQELE